jgi:hypothetical protein
MDRNNKYRVTKITDSGVYKFSLVSEQELQKLRVKRLQKIKKEESGLT